MIPQLNSSTTATIAITLIVLVGMYILYKDLKKLEVSIEKLQTRAACAKVLSKPPRNEIVEDVVLVEADPSAEAPIEDAGAPPPDDQTAAPPQVDVVGDAIQKLQDEVLKEEAAAAETA